MASKLFTDTVIRRKAQAVGKRLNKNFTRSRRSRAAAVASSTMIAIDGHPFAATRIGDEDITAVENVGRPAAAIYRGDAVDGSIVISTGGSGAGTGGGGTTNHPDLLGRDLPNQHPISATTNLRSELDARAVPRGDWSSAIIYKTNDWVLDSGYGAVSIADNNTDRPSPQQTRPPAFDVSGVFATGSLSAGTLFVTHRYVVTQSGFLSGYRVHIPEAAPNLVYQLIVIEDPDGVPIIDALPGFTPTVTGWIDVATSSTILVAGETFDIALVTQNTDGSSTFVGNWNYTKPQNPGTPAPGVIIHSTRDQDLFQISKIDDAAGARGPELETIGPGDTISGAGMLWTVQTATDNTTWMEFVVTPAAQSASVPAVYAFTFENFAVQPVSYSWIDGYWDGYQPDWSTVTSRYRIDDAAPVATNDGYGIDLFFAPATVSTKWKIYSYSGSSTGGAGGGGDTHDPVTSPLGTIDVAGVGGQEIEVNQAYNFNFGGNVSFTNNIDAPGVAHDGNFTITLTPTGNIVTDEFIQSSDYVPGSTGGRLDLRGVTGSELRTLDVRETATIGTVDTGSIVASGDLTISPGGYLELYPGQDVLMDGIQRFRDFDGDGPGVFIDWSGVLGSKFQDLDVEQLLVQQFTVKSAEVSVGQHIVGKSASQLTRPFPIPCDIPQTFEFIEGSNFEFINGNDFEMIDTYDIGTIYIKNVPGVGDMSAFAVGDDLTFRYFCESGGNPTYAAQIGMWNNAFGEQETPGGGNEISEDFEGVTLGDIPADWISTGRNNSMVSDPDAWGAYDNINIHPSRMMQTQALLSDDDNVHLHWTGSGYATKTNYEFSGMVYGASYAAGTGFTLFSDYPNTDTYVRIRQYSGQTYHVANHGYAAPDGGVTDSGFVRPIQDWVQFRIRIEDDTVSRTTLKARFWLDGDAEPTDWSINCWFDGDNRPTQGTFGLWGYQNAVGSYAVYDNLLVADVGGTPVDASATVNMISSSFSSAAVVFVTAPAPGGTPPALPTTVEAGFSYIGGGAVQNDQIVYAYERVGGFSDGPESWTFASTTYAWIAVDAMILDHTTGAGTFSTVTQQNAESWIDSQFPQAANEFELSVALANGSGSKATVGNAIKRFDSGRGDLYNYTVATLPFEDKPNEVTFSYGQVEIGQTFRVYYESIANPGTYAQYGLGYAKVLEREYPGDLETDEQAWSILMTKGPECPCELPSGAGIFDLGVAGDSFWIADAIDPLSGGAYDGVIQRGENPWDWTTKIRTGYLGGTQAQGILGLYYSEGTSLVELSETRAFFNNVYMEWSSGGERTAYIHENLGFAAYEDSQSSLDEHPRGYSLLASDSSILGGTWGKRDTATDTSIVRLESTYEYGINNTRSEVESSADTGNTATSSLIAFRGPYWTKPAQAGVIATIDANTRPATELIAYGISEVASLKLYETIGNIARLECQTSQINLAVHNSYTLGRAEFLAVDSADANNKAGIDAEMTFGGTGTTTIFAAVEMPDLPTTNPGGTGKLWNDAGTLKIT